MVNGWSQNAVFMAQYGDSWATELECGGGGDPYIRTLNAELYKLDCCSGYFRMLQGTLNSLPLTINVEMLLDSTKQEEEMNEWSESRPQFEEKSWQNGGDQTVQPKFLHQSVRPIWRFHDAF